jgi:hypothetical protein
MTLRVSPRIRFSLVLIAIFVNGLLHFPGLTAGVMLEVADLLSHPDQYDKQLVIVVGQVTNIQTAANRQGQSAYGFLLKDHNGSVKVVGLGKTEVHEGDQVIVEGIFNRLRQVGRTIIYNEIKANAITPVNRLNPDFVG